MADHPIKSVYVDGSDVNKGTARTHFMQRVPLVLTSAIEIKTMDVDATTLVSVNGRLYDYDSADTTSAHDGLTVLVDSTGRRFKTAEAVNNPRRLFQVLDKDMTAPPGSPGAGDSYIAGAGSTGAWATHDGKVAIWSGGIWHFIAPLAGDIAFISDEAGFYHRNAGNTAWVSGLPGTIGAGEILPSNLIQGFTFKVESTANDEAGGEPDGAGYIVGSSPTGAFSAFTANRIVIKVAGTWTQFPPAIGDTIDDKSQDGAVRWTGASWNLVPTSFRIRRIYYTGNATWTKPANLMGLRFIGLGAGGGGGSGSSPGGDGGDTSIGAHIVAGGGDGGSASSGGTGASGVASGSAPDIYEVLAVGRDAGWLAPFPVRDSSNLGSGGPLNSSGGDGGGGCVADGWVKESDLSATEAITIGIGGNGPSGAGGGQDGVAIIDEYIFT